MSTTRPGMAVLTIQFEVGEDRTQAIALFETLDHPIRRFADGQFS